MLAAKSAVGQGVVPGIGGCALARSDREDMVNVYAFVVPNGEREWLTADPTGCGCGRYLSSSCVLRSGRRDDSPRRYEMREMIRHGHYLVTLRTSR